MRLTTLSTPPLPAGLEDNPLTRTANALHSTAIHLLRHARVADRASGLSPERLSVLSVLTFGGTRTISELAQLEMVSPPAISRILTALEELGLAKRQRKAADARQVFVSATAKGRKLMQAGRKRRLQRIAHGLEPLSNKQIALLETATKLLQSLSWK
jgi:DNA-binding MarR family transcriptional regulator